MPRAFKASPDHPAVNYLVRLHADIGGKIGEAKKEVERLVESMKAVEAVIRLFAPDYDVTRIAARRRQRQNPWFKRGEMFRAAIGVLRGATAPMTAREIARAVIASQGVTDPDLKLLRTIEGGVRSCLFNKQGRTVERVGEGMPARWRLFPTGTP